MGTSIDYEHFVDDEDIFVKLWTELPDDIQVVKTDWIISDLTPEQSIETQKLDGYREEPGVKMEIST